MNAAGLTRPVHVGRASAESAPVAVEVVISHDWRRQLRRERYIVVAIPAVRLDLITFRSQKAGSSGPSFLWFYYEVVTNETPENPQSIPPVPPAVPDSEGTPPEAAVTDETAGQHVFGGTLSSDSAESPAASTPEPVVAPEQAPAPEQVVEPEAEQVIEPAPVSDAPPAQEYPPAAPQYPGSTPAPAAPAYPGAAPAYDAQSLATDPNAPASYPNGAAVPPNGPQGYSVDGYPAGAYAYPGAAPAPKKPMSKGLLWGIIGGAVALVLLIAAVIVVPALLRGPAQTASGVVEEYLTALSEGDAETALALVDSYTDDSLLTDEVLAASLELAPITDIVVEESEAASGEYETVVSASFAIGGETIERDFTVWKYSEDLKIGDGLVSASLSNFAGLGLTVNGAEPGDEYTDLFPGTYELALAYEEFTVDSEADTFTVATDDDTELFYEVAPILSEDGAATFRSLVRTAVEECVAMKTLTTPCGLDIDGIDLQGYTAVDGTVTRTITAEGQKTLDSMEPEVNYSAPTLVSTYDSPEIDTTLQGTKDGVTAEFEVWFGGSMGSPSVDFSEDTPTVIWE